MTSDDHKLMAITKHTSKLADNFVLRFFLTWLFSDCCSIVSGVITV